MTMMEEQVRAPGGHAGLGRPNAPAGNNTGRDADYDLVGQYPECRVTLEDLGQDLYFTNDSVDQVRARDAAFTEIKVG